MKDMRKKAKNIVVKFFNLTIWGHWWILIIFSILGIPVVFWPGVLDIIIVDLIFTWILAPIYLINLFLLTFKFLKDVYGD